MFVQDRDFVQRRKIWKDFPSASSSIIHFKSIEHKAAPVRTGKVRAHTIISGYFIETVCMSPKTTKIAIISQTDIKGSIPKWIVNSVSQKAPKLWINNLYKGCDMIKSNIYN
jgi:hypothetical protein